MLKTEMYQNSGLFLNMAKGVLSLVFEVLMVLCFWVFVRLVVKLRKC